jgi:hypothetical protein
VNPKLRWSSWAHPLERGVSLLSLFAGPGRSVGGNLGCRGFRVWAVGVEFGTWSLGLGVWGFRLYGFKVRELGVKG